MSDPNRLSVCPHCRRVRSEDSLRRDAGGRSLGDCNLCHWHADRSPTFSRVTPIFPPMEVVR